MMFVCHIFFENQINFIDNVVNNTPSYIRIRNTLRMSISKEDKSQAMTINVSFNSVFYNRLSCL